MAIEFQCSNCGKPLRTADETAGKHAKCPKCGAIMSIPTPGAELAPSPQSPWAAEPPIASHPRPGDAPEVQKVSGSGASAGTPPGSPEPSASSLPPYTGSASARAAGSNAGPQSGHQGHGRTGGEAAPVALDLGDVLNTALGIYKSQLGLCVAATAVALVVLIMAWFAVGTFLGLVGRFLPPLVVYTVLRVPAVVAVAAVCFSQCMRLFLKIARGEPASINDLFSIGPDTGRVALTSVILVLVIYAGLLLCVVPGWILMTIFFPAFFLGFERESPIDAIFTEAAKITEGNRLMVFAVLFVAGLIGTAGVLVCGVGALLTMPFALMCHAVMYLRLTGGRVAAVA